jgi:hypothetical protein
MPRVKVACNWEIENFNSLSHKIEKQFINRYNFAPDIQFTESDTYDYLVIFNSFTNHSEIRVAKEKVLGFILEPPFHTHYYDQNIGAYCQKVYTCSAKKYYINNDNFISAPSVMFSHLAGNAFKFFNNVSFNKAKKLSFCVSDKKGNQMYDFRRELVFKILESDLDCDIYGSGWEISDSRYKGNPADKAEALLDYEYSLSVENAIYDGYVSEKLFDCFLCNTVPVYFGSPTADTIYNPGSFLKLPFTGDFPALINWLKELTKSDSNSKFINPVLESKERYFRDYNIYNFIKRFARGEKKLP